MKKYVYAALLALAMGSAHAQVYVEGGFGLSHLDVDCSGMSDCDSDGTGFKLIGGYKLNPNAAVEIGYVDFGEAKSGYYGSRLTVKTSAIYAGMALRADLAAGFGGVLRLGLANVDTEVSLRSGYYGSGSDSESSISLLFGAGLEYQLTKDLRLTGALDFSTNEYEGESGTVRLLSVGLKYDF